VLENHAFEQRAHDLLLFRRHAGDRIEVQTQIVVGAALVLVEQQRIATDPERDGEPAQHRQRGLRLAGLVTLEDRQRKQGSEYVSLTATSRLY
jgi:hypothetical protein